VPYDEEEKMRIQNLLNKVLGPEYVSYRPGGGGLKVSYIEGWRALNLANEVFGFNGWNSELISTQVDYFDTHGNTGRFSMGLSVVVRVTIKDGTYHEDFGYGFIDNAKSKAMAFEKCKKEAFTDGVKRCLRCFGNVLGNCLYDRTIISKIQKVEMSKPEIDEINFHRDPIVREREKLKQTRVTIQENANSKVTSKPSATVPAQIPTQNPPPQAQKPTEHLLQLSTSPISKEFDDMDDSFLFSDDEDLAANRIDEELKQDLAHHILKNDSGPEKDPGKTATEGASTALPLFVSAKGATMLQESPQSLDKLPQFDTKFVAKSMRRTVDPHKSVPVKRTDATSSQPASSESTTNYMKNAPRNVNPLNPPSVVNDTTNALGKRIGLPPSQVANKRTRLQLKQ
jgi:DNA repair and recombination protein RAD52